ncbi:hypothetical protein D1872_76030 [compost metagenome]
MQKISLALFIALLIIYTGACSQKSVVQKITQFRGEGKEWSATYIYDPELYNDKKVNWIELTYKGSDMPELEDIDIQLKTRDIIATGNVGDMETKRISKKMIAFLVGTMNNQTYRNDTYRLKITCNGKQEEVLYLRTKE